MAQMTLYLPDELARRIRKAAASARTSVSAYLAELAERKLKPRAWPKGFAQLSGSFLGDFPEIADPRPEDIERMT